MKGLLISVLLTFCAGSEISSLFNGTCADSELGLHCLHDFDIELVD